MSGPGMSMSPLGPNASGKLPHLDVESASQEDLPWARDRFKRDAYTRVSCLACRKKKSRCLLPPGTMPSHTPLQGSARCVRCIKQDRECIVWSNRFEVSNDKEAWVRRMARANTSSPPRVERRVSRPATTSFAPSPSIGNAHAASTSASLPEPACFPSAASTTATPPAPCPPPPPKSSFVRHDAAFAFRPPAFLPENGPPGSGYDANAYSMGSHSVPPRFHMETHQGERPPTPPPPPPPPGFVLVDAQPNGAVAPMSMPQRFGLDTRSHPSSSARPYPDAASNGELGPKVADNNVTILPFPLGPSESSPSRSSNAPNGPRVSSPNNAMQASQSDIADTTTLPSNVAQERNPLETQKSEAHFAAPIMPKTFDPVASSLLAPPALFWAEMTRLIIKATLDKKGPPPTQALQPAEKMNVQEEGLRMQPLAPEPVQEHGQESEQNERNSDPVESPSATILSLLRLRHTPTQLKWALDYFAFLHAPASSTETPKAASAQEPLLPTSAPKPDRNSELDRALEESTLGLYALYPSLLPWSTIKSCLSSASPPIAVRVLAAAMLHAGVQAEISVPIHSTQESAADQKSHHDGPASANSTALEPKPTSPPAVGISTTHSPENAGEAQVPYRGRKRPRRATGWGGGRKRRRKINRPEKSKVTTASVPLPERPQDQKEPVQVGQSDEYADQPDAEQQQLAEGENAHDQPEPEPEPEPEHEKEHEDEQDIRPLRPLQHARSILQAFLDQISALLRFESPKLVADCRLSWTQKTRSFGSTHGFSGTERSSDVPSTSPAADREPMLSSNVDGLNSMEADGAVVRLCASQALFLLYMYHPSLPLDTEGKESTLENLGPHSPKVPGHTMLLAALTALGSVPPQPSPNGSGMMGSDPQARDLYTLLYTLHLAELHVAAVEAFSADDLHSVSTLPARALTRAQEATDLGSIPELAHGTAEQLAQRAIAVVKQARTRKSEENTQNLREPRRGKRELAALAHNISLPSLPARRTRRANQESEAPPEQKTSNQNTVSHRDAANPAVQPLRLLPEEEALVMRALGAARSVARVSTALSILTMDKDIRAMWSRASALKFQRRRGRPRKNTPYLPRTETSDPKTHAGSVTLLQMAHSDAVPGFGRAIKKLRRDFERGRDRTDELLRDLQLEQHGRLYALGKSMWTLGALEEQQSLVQLTAPALVLFLRYPAATTSQNPSLAQVYLQPHRTSRVLLEAEERLRRCLVSPRDPIETRETLEQIHQLRSQAAMKSLDVLTRLFPYFQDHDRSPDDLAEEGQAISSEPIALFLPREWALKNVTWTGKQTVEEQIVHAHVYPDKATPSQSTPLLKLEELHDRLASLATRCNTDTGNDMGRATSILMSKMAELLLSQGMIQRSLRSDVYGTMMAPFTPWNEVLSRAMTTLAPRVGVEDLAHAQQVLHTLDAPSHHHGPLSSSTQVNPAPAPAPASASAPASTPPLPFHPASRHMTASNAILSTLPRPAAVPADASASASASTPIPAPIPASHTPATSARSDLASPSDGNSLDPVLAAMLQVDRRAHFRPETRTPPPPSQLPKSAPFLPGSSGEPRPAQRLSLHGDQAEPLVDSKHDSRLDAGPAPETESGRVPGPMSKSESEPKPDFKQTQQSGTQKSPPAGLYMDKSLSDREHAIRNLARNLWSTAALYDDIPDWGRALRFHPR